MINLLVEKQEVHRTVKQISWIKKKHNNTGSVSDIIDIIFLY